MFLSCRRVPARKADKQTSWHKTRWHPKRWHWPRALPRALKLKLRGNWFDSSNSSICDQTFTIIISQIQSIPSTTEVTEAANSESPATQQQEGSNPPFPPGFNFADPEFLRFVSQQALAWQKMGAGGGSDAVQQAKRKEMDEDEDQAEKVESCVIQSLNFQRLPLHLRFDLTAWMLIRFPPHPPKRQKSLLPLVFESSTSRAQVHALVTHWWQKSRRLLSVPERWAQTNHA